MLCKKFGVKVAAKAAKSKKSNVVKIAEESLKAELQTNKIIITDLTEAANRLERFFDIVRGRYTLAIVLTGLLLHLPAPTAHPPHPVSLNR